MSRRRASVSQSGLFRSSSMLELIEAANAEMVVKVGVVARDRLALDDVLGLEVPPVRGLLSEAACSARC